MKEVHITGIITSKEYANEFDNEQTYSFDDLINDLAGETQAKVFIDSAGGMVEEGMKIYDHLNGLNIETIALNASSIASIIFLAGKKRYVKPGAKMIIHNAWLKGEDLDDMVINANSIEALKEEFEKQDAILIDIYKAKTSLNETKLLALMAQDTDVSDMAVAYGFADAMYEGQEEKKELQGCVMFNAAYRNMKHNLNSDNMASEQTNERLNGIEKALKGLSNLLFGKAKNMTVQLEDGTPIFVYSEDGEFEGKRAVLADSEGMPTEENAPAGTHRLDDGREIVVGEGGIIEAVKEAVDAEALVAELAAMEDEKKKAMEEKEELENKYNALLTEMAEKEAQYNEQFNNLTKEIKALKEEVIGEIEEPKMKAQIVTDDEWAKLTPSERFRRKMVAKAQND